MTRNDVILRSRAFFSVLLFALYGAPDLSGCAEDDAEADCGNCGAGWSCAEVSLDEVSSDLQSLYQVEPSDIVDIALGTWQGEYPGSDTTKPFTFTVTIEPLNENGTPVVPGSESLYGIAEPTAGNTKVPLSAREQCAGVYIAAHVVVQTNNPEFNFEQSEIGLHGFAIDESANPVSYTEFPRGVISVNKEIKDEGVAGHAELSFLFLPDSTVWVSAEDEEYVYYQSGCKSQQPDCRDYPAHSN